MTATWRGMTGGLVVVEAARVGIGGGITTLRPDLQSATTRTVLGPAEPPCPIPNGRQSAYRADTAASCLAFNSWARRMVRAISCCSPTR